ncbi:MAG: hypothetical protein A2Y21_01235 [Clostridiales bacterium GWC2_40_7]|nr:MAG: hypothetical protein A2Y21_01235 [Clostridiales bacterium GWC2_40_7]
MTVDLISRIAEKARAGNSGSIPVNNSDLIVNLPINAIKYHPKNHLYFKDLDKAMKDKLMEDMRDNGQINPIIVKKNDDDTYTVLAGHQRLIAARRLNWQQIKAIVIEVSEFEAEKLLIRDNLFRRHMGGMELARALDAYSKLSDNQTRKSIRQIAEEIGENRNTVHFYIKLNTLIPEIQQLVDDKKLTPTAAQAFTSLNEEEQRKSYEALGESIVGIKKKELEEEIRKQYESTISNVNEEKNRIEGERNKLLSDVKSKEKDVELLKGQAEIYRQQAEEFKNKTLAANVSEEVMTILSKLDVLDSLAASICLPSLAMYDENSISILLGRLNGIHSNLISLLNLVSAASQRNMENTETEPLEN